MDGIRIKISDRVVGVAFVLFCVVVVISSSVSDELVAQRRRRAFDGISSCSLTVEYGDSLWNIAEAHAVTGATTEEVVRWIIERNDLASSYLRAGYRLVVPSTSR